MEGCAAGKGDKRQRWQCVNECGDHHEKIKNEYFEKLMNEEYASERRPNRLETVSEEVQRISK